MEVLVLGPAGSGKSLLTGNFGPYLQKEGYTVKYMNLDPGVLDTSYKPDFDVREKFTVEQIMKHESLGPNGAILRAMDMLAELEVPIYEVDFTLIDTPGQLEPFIFRDAGEKIVKKLRDCCCIFIIDATSPKHTLPSFYLYSLAAKYTLGVNMVIVLNKVDLLEAEKIKEFKVFLENPEFTLKNSLEGLRSEIDSEIASILKRFLPAQRIPFVSAKTWEGFEDLLAVLYEAKCVCGDLT